MILVGFCLLMSAILATFALVAHFRSEGISQRDEWE